MVGSQRTSVRLGRLSLHRTQVRLTGIVDAAKWFEEHFFDPDHPLDSDWLMDAEEGRLFTEDIEQMRAPKSLDVNEVIIEEATNYMDQVGLAPRYRPRLELVDGQVYAVKPDGDAIRLDHSLYWERDTGFVDMVEDQLEIMASERLTLPRLWAMRILED